jgi:hypothetical protein
MPVNDNGNEVLRKAANEVEDGSYTLSVVPSLGTDINPLAKYVEATYSAGDTVVTYNYYESSSKVTLYNTITVTYSVAQDTSFTSADWS